MINRILHFYNRALRTAVLAQDNLSQRWYVVFSTIELLTPDSSDYAIPQKDWNNGKLRRSSISSQGDAYTFYLVVHPISTPQEAWSLFQNPVGPQEIDGILSHSFSNKFVKEPNSTYPLVLPSTLYAPDNLSEILPRRQSGIYVWAQIDTTRVAQSMFGEMSSREAKAISQLTKDWLGFDRTMLSEHLGNQYLSAVNPYYRSFNLSLSDEPIGINYKFHYRKGIKEKIYARVTDKHGINLTFDKIFQITEGGGTFELPHEPHLNEVRLYNEFDDFIGLHEPATFLKSVAINVSMKSADLHVDFHKGGKSGQHKIEKFVKATESKVGHRDDFNAAYYFERAERTRSHVRLAETNDFIFFKGSKDGSEKTKLKLQAKEAIRNIINQAQDVCYLCDPYFNVDDLVEYAFYSRNASAELRIVNCKGAKFVDKEKAENLWEGIKKYNEKFPEIKCRMLIGESILHDRFIIADRKVWFIGSSFSEFGSRATCIARVPESADKEISAEIQKWYFNEGTRYTVSIEDFINLDNDE